jgi:uncharacterized protein
MVKALVFATVVLCGLTGWAQQGVADVARQSRVASQALSPDAPTRDQIMTLLDATQARKTMQTTMDGLKQIMTQAAEKNFREKVPNPTPKQLEAFRGIYDDIADMPLDEMIDALIAIYQRHLTKTDIEEMIRFYSSPLGQKLLRVQPQILQESMQAGAAIQQKRMDQIMAKVKERVQTIVEASGDDTKPQK